jgi:predicted dehydrogenase
MDPKKITLPRRAFLKSSAAAGLGVLTALEYGGIAHANEKVHVAVLGVNGRGKEHVKAYSGMKDAEVAAIVDPDQRTFEGPVREAEGRQGRPPSTFQDLRRVLDDKNIDAISIATPNHWHALATIWGCQAGKDVYVEKPCSHNPWEGRAAVEAARKHNRIVQHGTQSRSASGVRGAIEYLRSGKLGKVYLARGLCYKPRGSIGFKQTESPPPELDFNLWLGPAPEQPFHQNLVHYNWHWMWDTGNGDIGNQGVHEMDVARWGLGVGLPKSVVCFGGRLGYADQGQTPNTQVALFDYGEVQLMFEVRGLKTPQLLGVGVGNIFYGTEGTLVVGHGIFRKGSDKPEPIPPSESGGDHFQNFIDCVRSRKREDLRADILEGHLSSTLCHLANISYRLGKPEPFHSLTAAFGENRQAYDALGRVEEHLMSNGVKLEETAYFLGRRLAFLPAEERFQDDPEANKLLTRDYRKPFAPDGTRAV